MFYIQRNASGHIVDCIEYAHEGYERTDLVTPLPNDILGGHYKYEDGHVVYDRAKFEELNEIELLRQSADEILDIIEGGFINANA